jgi:hypothetical protein
MKERITWVDYNWKNESIEGDTKAMVVVLNHPDLYQELVNDESYDNRIWFYFQDEAEFQRAFDKNNDEFEFTLIREVGTNE